MKPDVRPLLSYAAPVYPTWEAVEADPSLLVRALPSGWRCRDDVLAALTAAVFGLGAVAASAEGAEPGQRAGGQEPRGTGAEPGLVAVVFPHGEGRGSFGCVMVTPPAFLSEEEARQVIREEMESLGILFTEDALILPDLARGRHYVVHEADFPDTTSSADSSRSSNRLAELRGWVFRARQSLRDPAAPKRTEEDEMAQPLVVDGLNLQHGIGFEYVSKQDYRAIGGLNPGEITTVDRNGRRADLWASVGEYDFQDAARHLAQTVNQVDSAREQPPREDAGDATWPALRALGVFYDPMQAATGRETLRRQVADFAVWLCEQGILR